MPVLIYNLKWKKHLTAVGDCAFIAHNKEFNFVPTLKASTSIWFNYRQTGGQPTNDNFIINEYVFGNGANKALASIKDGLFSGAATYVRDSNNNTNTIDDDMFNGVDGGTNNGSSSALA